MDARTHARIYTSTPTPPPPSPHTHKLRFTVFRDQVGGEGVEGAGVGLRVVVVGGGGHLDELFVHPSHLYSRQESPPLQCVLELKGFRHHSVG